MGNFYCLSDKGKQRALSVCVCNLTIPVSSAPVPALVPPLCKWGVCASTVKWKYGKKKSPYLVWRPCTVGKNQSERCVSKWRECWFPWWTELRAHNRFWFSKDAVHSSTVPILYFHFRYDADTLWMRRTFISYPIVWSARKGSIKWSYWN